MDIASQQSMTSIREVGVKRTTEVMLIRLTFCNDLVYRIGLE